MHTFPSVGPQLTWQPTDEGLVRRCGGAFSCQPGWWSIAWHASSQHSWVDGSACRCSACALATAACWALLSCSDTTVNLAATFAHSLADTLAWTDCTISGFLAKLQPKEFPWCFPINKFSSIPCQNLPHSLFPSSSSLLLSWLSFSIGWTKYFCNWRSAGTSQSSSA